MPISAEALQLTELLKTIGSHFPPDDDNNTFLERAVYDQVVQAGTECKGVALSQTFIHSENAPGQAVEAILFTPETAEANSKNALLFMHGGGYTFGSPNGHRRLTAHLANACGCVALSVHYRLAPEHKFPAALDDCVAGYKHLLNAGYQKIVVAGDSCGGGLSTAVPLALLKQGLPSPTAGISISPWYDMTTVEGGTFDSNEGKDVLNAKPFVKMLAVRYVDGSGYDKDGPLVSPLKASDEDLKQMPPHWISVAGSDMLADHGTRMADRLKKLGVEAELRVHDGLQHVFEFGAGKVPESDKSIQDIGRWVQSKFKS